MSALALDFYLGSRANVSHVQCYSRRNWESGRKHISTLQGFRCGKVDLYLSMSRTTLTKPAS